MSAEASPSAAPARRSRLVLALVLLALAALAALALLRMRSGKAKGADAPVASERAIAVQIAVVSLRDVPVHVDGLGTVVPTATVSVKSQVDGRLESVLFREGQEVKAGDVLAVVDPRPYQAQLRQSEAVVKKDQALLANGKLTQERLKRLRNESLASQQELDDQNGQVAQLEAQLAADRASAESARLALGYSRIKSPVAGVVGVRLVDPGNVVRASDAQGIVVVTSLDPITVVFPVPQDAVPAIIRAKAAGPLGVSVFARDGAPGIDAGAPLSRGELLVVDNQIDPQTSMVKLKAQLPNPAHTLWPGAFVRARLELAVRTGVTVVPEGAIQQGPEGAFVYLVGEGEKVEMRAVSTEPGDGEFIIVSGGLQVGERVVEDGQSQLRVGAKVVPRGGKP